MIRMLINRFYKLTADGNSYKRIDSQALCYPQERETIIMDIEDVLYGMTELHELTMQEKRNYRIWHYVVGELKIWCTR